MGFSEIRKKWHLMIYVVPILILIFILKVIFHKYDLEVIELNALFTSLIAANIFLIGFILSGVISDFRESERIPSEMVCSLEVIYDEIMILNKNKDTKEGKEFLVFYLGFVESLNLWFYKKEKTNVLLEKLSLMNSYFAKIEPTIQANFISRMKNEQSNLRKMILRVNNIRDLDFIASAYAVLEALTILLIIGLILLNLEPFYEGMFFTMIVSFLIIYMTLLIKDLDNPFDYTKRGEANGSVVSLEPFNDYIERINLKKKKITKNKK